MSNNSTTETTAYPTAIKEGDQVRITKGCRNRDIRKGDIWTVAQLTVFLDKSFTITIRRGSRAVLFQATHINKLDKPEAGVHDGNPFHKIFIKKV